MAKRVDLFVQCLGLAETRKTTLELGCGTGMLLFRIAPLCEHYHAVDVSASAIDHVMVDAVVPSSEIGGTISAMVNGEDLPPGTDPSDPPASPPGSKPATTICPECGGVLSERTEAGTSQWGCLVGHRYSPETLVDAQADDVEAALWTAIRALGDRSLLLHRTADQAHARGQSRSARSFRHRAVDAEEQADLVRRVLARAAEQALRKTVEDEAPDRQEGTAA